MNLTVRRATVADVDALVDLRIMLLREVGEIKEEEEATIIAEANRKYFDEALPAGEFVAWIAEVDGAVDWFYTDARLIPETLVV